MQVYDTGMLCAEPHKSILLCQRGCKLIIALQVALVKDFDRVLPSCTPVSRQHDLSPPHFTSASQSDVDVALTVE